MANQEGERARKLENPTTRGPIEGTAKRAAALAEKFERARRLTRGQRLLALNREWALKEHDRPVVGSAQVTMRLAWARSASDEPLK